MRRGKLDIFRVFTMEKVRFEVISANIVLIAKVAITPITPPIPEDIKNFINSLCANS